MQSGDDVSVVADTFTPVVRAPLAVGLVDLRLALALGLAVGVR